MVPDARGAAGPTAGARARMGPVMAVLTLGISFRRAPIELRIEDPKPAGEVAVPLPKLPPKP